MFCKKCGRPIEDGQTLCSACAAQEDDAVTVMGDTFDLNTSGEAAQKKSPKKKGKLIAAIVALAVVVACTLGIVFNMDAIKGFTSRTFKSPETYFVDVESAVIAEYTEELTDSYGEFLDSYQEDTAAAKGEIRLTLGDTLLTLLETTLQQQGLQMDVDWLREIKLAVNTNIQDNAMRYVLGVGLGDHDVLSADVILDVEDGKVYGAVPELSKDYLSVDLSSVDPDAGAVFQNAIKRSRGMMEKLIRALPSEEALGNLIETYTDLFLAGIKTVERQNSTITVNGVTQKVVELKATITEANLLDIAKNILNEARNDQNLKKVIAAYGDYINEMGKLYDEYYEPVDLYQEFVDSIDDALAELEEEKAEAASSNYLELKTYVDMKNRLRGHSLTVYGEDQEQTGPFEWLTAVKDDTTYTEAKIGQVQITGEKTKKNDVSNGSFTLCVKGKEMVTLELENVGENGGTLRLCPSSELMTEALSGSSIPAALLADNVALELTYSAKDSDKTACELSVMMGAKPLFSLALSSEATAGGKISIPSNALDATNSQDLVQWLADMNFDNVLTALEKANVPTELLDLVRGYLAMLQYGMI